MSETRGEYAHLSWRLRPLGPGWDEQDDTGDVIRRMRELEADLARRVLGHASSNVDGTITVQAQTVRELREMVKP